MLDRDLTRRIAELVAGSDGGPVEPPGDLAGICDDARRRIVAYTGLVPADGVPVCEPVSRPEWIAANVASMAALLDPVTERMGGGFGPLRGPARAAFGLILSAEAGALAGYLSRRVLGQYELILLDDSPARLLMVTPNVARAAEGMEVDSADLLTWVAFHEVTHAVQFGGVTWLRGHIGGLLRELLDSLELTMDPRALLRLPGSADLRGLADAVREHGFLSVVAGSARQDLLARIQVAMAVIEGHAEHVMDVVGTEALDTTAQLRAALDRRRRERPPLLALLERLIGLDAKMRQYQEGKRFCDAVVAAAGPAALHRVFDAPDRLPSPAELDDPSAWIRRTAVAR